MAVRDASLWFLKVAVVRSMAAWMHVRAYLSKSSFVTLGQPMVVDDFQLNALWAFSDCWWNFEILKYAARSWTNTDHRLGCPMLSGYRNCSPNDKLNIPGALHCASTCGWLGYGCRIVRRGWCVVQASKISWFLSFRRANNGTSQTQINGPR